MKMSRATDLDSISYPRNFLTKVLARVDLASPLAGLQNELPKNISKAALQSFPIAEPKPAFSQEVVVTAKDLTAHKEEYTQWNFYGRNREKRLRIVPEAFFVVYNNYDRYETLRQEFLTIVDSFFTSFEADAQPSRLGLRYINQLDVPGSGPLDWQAYVNDELLGLFSYAIEEAQLSRVFSNFEVVFSDFNLRFQFGVHNPDYPAPMRRRAFVLDYDAYFKGPLEPNEIRDCLNKYHEAIQRLFERSITDKLREIMNETA